MKGSISAGTKGRSVEPHLGTCGVIVAVNDRYSHPPRPIRCPGRGCANRSEWQRFSVDNPSIWQGAAARFKD